MSFYGIAGYEPVWRPGTEVRRDHGERLAALAGRRLTAAWLVWNTDRDAWFPDGPVIFDFEGERVELNHFKLDELSVTWNLADVSAPIGWSESRLSWRSDAEPCLTALVGRVLRAVELLVFDSGGRYLADGTVAVRFDFGDTGVTVFNALDENGLSFAAPGEDHRRVPLP
ncbi:hypothetical protein Afil01_51370 [Actinorhabdospora filicis]|uniref:Uncharacterized protein n=1 Tax=Actinorhabdospora filicis TaxID=1785913 RepID=A0A9W6WCZ8_9ACTN|nr:hypothetical protein [Actinorhabdospora filicis]GLZ80330.1 hypothetical protein Afil01_51370 [Actinorhabdospora filicis]